MNPAGALEYLGLDDKERRAYLALLELGESTVLGVSKKAEVKRPTAYLVLEALEAKGYVSRVIKKKKVFFAPQHPQKIVTEAELRLKEMKDVVPQLEALMQRTNERPRVMIYEGKSALDKAYDESFVIKGEVLFMSNTALVLDVFARTVAKQTYVSFSPEFRMREVLDDSPESRAFAARMQGPYHQFRIMPKEFSPFTTDIGVFGNISLITSGQKEYFTVKIESQEIANAFRAMFEAMWQISKPIETTGALNN